MEFGVYVCPHYNIDKGLKSDLKVTHVMKNEKSDNRTAQLQMLSV